MQKQEDSRLKWLTNENKEFAQKERELRKNLESALEETKAEKNNLHDFFMQAPVPMVILDGKDLLFTLANPLYEKLVGRQVVGKTLVQAFEPGEVDLYIPILNKVLETGVPYIGKEMPLALPDDHNVIQHKWIDLGYHPLKSQDGKIKGLMAIVQDVTAQVEARKIIEARESHFRQISDGLSLMIWISGPEGVIYWANTWWYNYTGFKHLDLTGKDSPVHPDDIPEGHERWLHSMSSGEDFNIEMRFKRKSDNTYRWHLVKAVAVRTANGNIEKWVGSSVDIEHQKFLVSELEQEKDLREKFVAALTHDLRTPLTGAKMSAQILDRKVSDDMRSLTSKIISSVDRADHMVQDLLDAGKIKAGEKFLLNLKLCDLNDIVNNTIEDLSTVHGSRFKIESNQHIEGMWDGDVIRRILENLANNAVKYGSMESPIEIKLKSDGKDASIAVHNKGNPISPDEQSKLFEAYRRSESATTSNQKGWGIGLTLVQGFSKALGGDVRVTSSINEGTTFTVSLPQKQNT